MPRRSLITDSAYFLRDFGGKVAMSLAASAFAAAFLAVPGLLGDDGSAKIIETQRLASGGLPSAIAPDGKIRERHHDVVAAIAAADRAGPGLLVPAIFAMPMNTAWPQAEFGDRAPTAGRAVIAEARPVAAAPAPAAKHEIALVRPRATAQALMPPQRPVTVAAERVANPPVIAAQTAALEESPPTIVRVGGAMSSAVGSVGAAGLWTLSRASALLPGL
jgi:hypothetical protein